MVRGIYRVDIRESTGFDAPYNVGMKNPRLVIALILIAFTLISYYSRSSVNPVTGEKQHIGNITAAQEIALGLQSAPEMAAQHGGETRNAEARELVERVGRRLVERTGASKSPYRYEFHALADPRTVNAFALPGGQVFITMGLLSRLRTEGELAGVLGHEIGHVVGRHGAEHLAKAQLAQGLTGAAVMATYDPNNPASMRSAQVAQMISNLLQMRYGRGDELESDRLGVRFLAEAGYDPRALLGVMEVLKSAGAGGQPEFFSTHPNPERRIEKIHAAIREAFPQGVPEGLEP
jgi:predicted Zn-dependent protease